MTALRRHLHRATLLAWLAVLALALVPTLSRLLGQSGWAEVCTPQGMQLAAVAGDGEPALALDASRLDHCALCSLSAGAAPLPSAAPAPGLLPVSSTAPPAQFLQPPRTLLAWRSAQPRAPPSFA